MITIFESVHDAGEVRSSLTEGGEDPSAELAYDVMGLFGSSNSLSSRLEVLFCDPMAKNF
jgi:hypothetical protein